MDLCLMSERHFPQVAAVDFAVYESNPGRLWENLLALRTALPECAYVMLDNEVVTGYSFSKMQGDEAFIGPIAVRPEYQKAKLGTAMILASTEYLKQHCKIIGLEVRPLKVDNISLYSSLGFRMGFPTLNYEVKDFPYIKKRNLEILVLESITDADDILFDAIESWLADEYNLSYKADFHSILSLKGKIMVAVDNNMPVGFLAHGGYLSPHIWGNVKQCADKMEILKALLKAAATLLSGPLIMGVNARYYNVINLLTELRFNIIFVLNRMLLDGYGGKFFNLDEGISIRSWVG